MTRPPSLRARLGLSTQDLFWAACLILTATCAAAVGAGISVLWGRSITPAYVGDGQ